MSASEARFQRHSLIDWFDQELVSACSVLVVGAGAIGNEVLKNLCLLGVGNIHIVDFDKIEEHNLTRTVLFSPDDIGKGKAECAALACRRLSPKSRVTFEHGDFWDLISLRALDSFDAVLCCVDNLEARIRLNSMCRIAAVPLINGAIDSRRVAVQHFPFGKNPGAACYECWLPPSAYATMQKRYSCGWLKKAAFNERKVPTTAITASAAGAQMTSLLLQGLCGHPEHPEGSLHYTLDTVNMYGGLLTIDKSPDCPTCGRSEDAFRILGASRRAIAGGIAIPTCDRVTQIQLSDPIIISAKCAECGLEEEIMGLASKFDDGLVICVKCRKQSRSLRIVDSLEDSELSALFAERELPVKYLSFTDKATKYIIELE